MEADSSDRTVLSAPPALPVFGVDLTGDGKLGYGFTSADELEEVDIGHGDKPRPTFISKKLDPQLRSQMVALLKEYPDCFAWDYTEMPGLDRSIIEHRLPLKKGFRPFQQRARQMRAEILEEVKKEIEKMLAAGFIRPCRYAEWISSIVPVEKKDGRWRVAIDFRDLNRATPKDEYPMPVAETLINAAAGHKVLSFMDGNAGYNQIFMAPEDIHKTAFRVPGAQAFDEIKRYLTTPVLVPPRQDKPFYIYLSVADTSIASVVVQLYEGVERVVFYLSRRMLDAETRYPEVEKLCLCLFFTCTKLHHILLTAEIFVICKSDVVKHMLSAPVLKGRLAAGGTFMSITLGEATRLLDNMMINYSEWHTERAPQGKKVNSVEESSSLNDKIDAIMSMLVNDRSNVDPNNVPLASLVAQEEHVDVNFIKNNNFNNNAYRNNSSNNYRPYPYNNGNGYGNSYGNSYNNNRSSPPGLEAMLKEFISTQTAFNKSVEEKLGKIDILVSRVDSLASDVDLLKSKVLPNENYHNKITTTANAIQVRINENIRLMAELRARWDREENEKLAKEKNIAKVWTITTTSNANATHVAAPPTHTNKRIGVSNVSTSNAKREKLPETAKTAETACDKAAEIFSNIGDDDPIALDYNGLNFDDCHISEVIKFLQKLAKSPNASAINLAFTHHITNALIKAREEKLEREASIPKKLEDGWEPIIKMKVKDFDCNALCDLGASISVMPKKIYNMLDLPPLKNCYLDVNLADHSTKKPLGKVDNVRITVNNNLVPVDFVVLDIECNASCPIILGRPFLRTVGAIIDMREGNIKYQFPLKKGMEHFPRKRIKVPYDSIIRTNYDVDASSLDVT
ncbi:hypothetical protein QYE76_055556 [Lolium multiflorum]|uniref:Reverse transcriptase/retrotransposon-derived protein RNase H-like domain-containing protein n=1 Tax=Lolium multiflorum TaxID=4521 RepID=A0AAD8T0L4_LOLMU|nr:hypothetical protein QYE76_055556 [Lolium multiflorum]